MTLPELLDLKSRITKGLWRVAKGKYGLQIWADVREGFSCWIANIKCESDPKHEEANAALIAAAPDLLAALIEAMGVLQGISDGWLTDDHEAAVEAARAFLAKYKGDAE